MGFFPEVSLPPPNFKATPNSPMPWDDGLGVTALSDLMLAQGPEGAVLLRSVVCFSDAAVLTFEALLRRPLVDGPGTQGHNAPVFSTKGELRNGLVLVGIELSDGSRGSNVEEGDGVQLLLPLGGSGGSFRGQQRFATAVPPEGELTFWVAWPAAGIPETSTMIDAQSIRDAARHSKTLGV